MFKNDVELIYLGMENGRSETGKPYSLVTFFNPETYDKYTFYASPDIKISVGQKAKAIVTLDAYLYRGFVNFSVSSISAA